MDNSIENIDIYKTSGNKQKFCGPNKRLLNGKIGIDRNS